MNQLVTAARVNLLIQVADARARDEGYEPNDVPELHAMRWENAAEEQHQELAREAGMKLDPIAVRQFVEALWGRAERLKGRAA